MQGILIDENGTYVNAAIVKLTKIKEFDEEADGGSEEDIVTYGKTDEAGRFTVENIDPVAEYIIEVQVAKPELCRSNDDNLESEEEYLELIASEPIRKSLEDIHFDTETERSGISRNCMYRLDCELKEKLYQMKNSL